MDDAEALRQRVKNLEDVVDRLKSAERPLVRGARLIAWSVGLLILVVCLVALVWHVFANLQHQVWDLSEEVYYMKQQLKSLQEHPRK